MNLAEQIAGVPAAPLRPYIRQYVGYHYRGFDPGVHFGLPSPDLTMVVSFSEPTRVAMRPDAAPAGFAALISGLSLAPAFIHHDGNQFGVQLAVTPLGARSLFGLPAAALANNVAPLELEALTDRLRAEGSWPQRFALLDEILSSLLKPAPPCPELAYAWERVLHSGGILRVADLAEETGWSRRRLYSRFTAEFGTGPKDALRLVRFGRSRELVGQPNRPSLAEIASTCGYYDQAHLAREWRELAGLAPSHWLEGEEFPISTSHASASNAMV